MSRPVLLGALVSLFAIGTSRAAYAYIDPGSASLLLQGAIGAVAAGLVALKLYWHKVKTLFAGRSRRSRAGEPAEGQ